MAEGALQLRSQLLRCCGSGRERSLHRAAARSPPPASRASLRSTDAARCRSSTMGGRSTACWATSAGATEGWCLVVAKKQQRGGKAKAGGKGKAPAVDDALGPGGQALARLFHPTQVDAGWDDRGLVHERRPPAPLGRPTRGGESACAPRTSCRRIVCLGVHASVLHAHLPLARAMGVSRPLACVVV